MTIIKNRNILLLAFILLWIASSLSFSQNWVPDDSTDGDAIFHPDRTSYELGIADSIAGILQMQPQYHDTLHIAGNRWKLDGIEWQYDIGKYGPNDAGYLKHASDVDDITAFMGEPAYLITDLNDNKVIIHNPDPSSLEPIWNLHPAAYAGPSDASFLREGDQNRVLVTYKTSNVVVKFSFGQSVLWTYGQLGTAGSGPNQLNGPSDAVKIDSTNEYLIADAGNKRVIIVDEEKNITWSVSGTDTLSTPADVDYIYGDSTGDKILITDQTMHKVFIINRNTHAIEWTWGTGTPGNSLTELNNPSDADYVPASNHVLIADKGNNRILEVNLADSSAWVWPNPVPEVEDVDAYGSDGFLVVQKEVVSGTNAITWLPTVLRFTDRPQTIISDIYQVEKSVNFSNIFWESDSLAAGTSIGFQFRSGIDFGDIAKNPWLGPDADTTSVYTTSGDALIASHVVHQLYQFKAILQTTNPRATPSIARYGVRYVSYDTTSSPLIFTRPIGPDSSEQVTVKWDSVVLRWKIPPELRSHKNDMDFRMAINNAGTSLPVYSYRPNPFSTTDNIRLTDIDALKEVKQIYLTINLLTHNTALTPKLDSWSIYWRQKETQASVVEFVNKQYESKQFYTATSYIPQESDTIFVDNVYLKVSNNISEISGDLNLGVSSMETQDTELDTLSLKTGGESFFGSNTGVPIVIVGSISDAVVGNGILEVLDRDQLSVQYQSPQRPSEVSTDSIMIVQGTIGNLTVENVARAAIQSSTLGERLYFRVASENDRNLNPASMDSLQITVVNNNTRDEEQVTLYELPSNGGVYNSGEFESPDSMGILLRDDPSYQPNDGFLYSRLGDIVHAVYQDNFKKEATRVYVSLPDTIVAQMTQPLLCEIAPNPYYASRDPNFRMRVASSVGALTMKLIEVFNIAGEKVLEINGDDVRFADWGGNSVGINRYGVIENWWNLLSDSGHQISSGTYWVKIQADVLQESSNVTERISTLAKFIVIR